MGNDVSDGLYLLGKENEKRCKFGATIMAARTILNAPNIIPITIDWDFVLKVLTDFDEFKLHQDEVAYVNAVIRYLGIPGRVAFPGYYLENLEEKSKKYSSYMVSKKEIIALNDAVVAFITAQICCIKNERGMQQEINVVIPDLTKIYENGDLQALARKFCDTSIAFFAYHKFELDKISLTTFEGNRSWLTLKF